MSERRFISWAAMFHLLGKVSLAIHRERDCYCSGIRKLYSIGTKSPTTYSHPILCFRLQLVKQREQDILPRIFVGCTVIKQRVTAIRGEKQISLRTILEGES